MSPCTPPASACSYLAQRRASTASSESASWVAGSSRSATGRRYRPMKPDELESRMRRLEWFHSLRVPEGAWTILRLDGRGFSGFTEARCEKPFDERFHGWMVRTSQA